MISRSEIMKNKSISKENSAAEGGKNLFTQPQDCFERGCVKSLFMALRAKLYFDRHMISTISRSEIVEIMCLSKECSAAAGGKRLLDLLRWIIVVGKMSYFLSTRSLFEGA